MWRLLIACGAGETELPEPEPETPTVVEATDPEQAAADAFYDPARIVDVAIEIAPADALALAAQTNDLYAFLTGEDCLAEPWNGPFTWFPADLTLDGTEVPEVGIRKKGLIGSLSTEKPSLKVDLDEYVQDQRYDGLEHLTLNNAISDPTWIRQCLGYALFADAGLPAPRCNFASVVANGDPLGIYVNVEPPKKLLLRNIFGEDTGDLYEGTLSDFRTGWTGTFEPDTDETDVTLAPILAITAALSSADPVSAVGEIVDLPQFYRFWAMETLIGHIDGYAGNTNNFYVYFRASDGLAEFIPWGIDSTFWHYAEFGGDTQAVVLANSQLTRTLWESEEGRAGYLAAMRDLLDTVWDGDALLAEIDRMAELVGSDPIAIEDLRAFVAGREAEMEELLADEPPIFEDALRGDICIVETGTMSISFDGTWDSLGSLDPLSEGSSTLSGDYGTGPFDETGAALAGEDAGYGLIIAVALTGPTTLIEALVFVPLEWMTPGEIEIDGLGVAAYLIEDDFTNDDEAVILGAIVGGTLVLEQASLVPGAPVVGTFEGPLFVGGLFE